MCLCLCMCAGERALSSVCVFLTERNRFIIENINPINAWSFSLIGICVFVLGGAVVFRPSRSLCGCSEALKCLLLSIISMVTVVQYKPPVQCSCCSVSRQIWASADQSRENHLLTYSWILSCALPLCLLVCIYLLKAVFFLWLCTSRQTSSSSVSDEQGLFDLMSIH